MLSDVKQFTDTGAGMHRHMLMMFHIMNEVRD